MPQDLPSARPGLVDLLRGRVGPPGELIVPAAEPAVDVLLVEEHELGDVDAGFDKLLDTVADKLPEVHDHLDEARASPSPPSPRRSGARSGPTTPTSASASLWAEGSGLAPGTVAGTPVARGWAAVLLL